jgi:hypothetical protein
MPFAFPPRGRDGNTGYRAHPVDLLAQKVSLSVPALMLRRMYFG